MAKALELAVKERKNGTGKDSWHDLQVPKVQVTRGVQGHTPWKNFEISMGILECISNILEQKLECLNRTQIAYQILAFLRVISKEKKAASSCEIAGKFLRPPVVLRTLMKTC